MRKKNSKRILGRTANHRRALMRNLTDSLLQHGSIVTTEAKGKELRGHFEPLVTAAKQDITLARRRELLAQVHNPSAVDRLLEVAKMHASRPGGYLRITKLPRRAGDGASTVRVDILQKSENNT